MKNYIKIIILWVAAFGIVIFPIRPAYSQYPRIYEHYLEKAQESIQKEDYRSALLYLETAQTVYPESPEVLKYLNVVKQAIQQRVQPVKPIPPSPPIPDQQENKNSNPSVSIPSKRVMDFPSQVNEPVKPSASHVTSAARESHQSRIPVERDMTLVGTSGFADDQERERIIFELNDEALDAQPDMEIELSLDQEILVRGQNIERYLVISQDVLEIERQGNREILIVPKIYGQTFFHIWDAQKRWTFYIKTIFPTERADRLARIYAPRERYEKPFRFIYNTSWDSFYRGDSPSRLDRQSYHYRNHFGLKGPSPYGDLDAYAIFYQTSSDDMDLTDYSMGLTHAAWKEFKDIHVRIFDASRQLSDLTMPGRDFRGVLLSGMTADERFSLTALRGRDRASFGLLSTRDTPHLDSYVEAGKLSFHPNKEQTFSANYAHAWGEDKVETAKSHVYSIEFDQNLERWQLSSEVAYDQDEFAQMVWSQHQFDGGDFFMRARNIPSNYATIIGATGNQGEEGAEFSLSHQFAEVDMTHYLDLYRDRDNKNPTNEDAINIDFHSNFFKQLSYRDSASGSFYAIHTPGTLSDRTDFRILGTLNHRMDFLWFSNAMLSWTGSYQRSRSGSSPSADYDRTGLMSNFYLPLSRYFNYYVNYEIYYVDDVATHTESYPYAVNTGVSYSQPFLDKWRVNAHIYYRDEEKTEEEKSFMAGQDSLAVGAGVDYSPRSGVNFYIDGRLRNVWAENNRTSPYVEADIRFGMRSEWDLGYSWNPKGIIQGHVFRDLNHNGINDDEPGIAGVKVKIGDGEAVTDHAGWYYQEVKAKVVQVSLDVDTMPKGYVFTDAADKIFDIQHNGFYDGSFALSTQSGIYGVIFHDKNHNGRPDNGDEFLYKVRLVLDRDKQTETDSKGTYFFYNISEGEHSLALDLNSLPSQYLPTIPLVNNFFIAEGAMYLFHIPVKEK